MYPRRNPCAVMDAFRLLSQIGKFNAAEKAETEEVSPQQSMDEVRYLPDLLLLCEHYIVFNTSIHV